MMRFVRDFRLIPVVLLATACLLGLKVIGIVLDGGFTLADFDFGNAPSLGGTQSGPPRYAGGDKTSWAQEMFNFPEVTGAVDSDKQKGDKNKVETAAPPVVQPVETQATETKATETKAPETKGPAGAKAPETKSPGGTVIRFDQNNGVNSPAERAILERLGERRQELDARARELEIRENLVRSAERRLDGRVNEIKGLETQLNGTIQKKEEADAARLKGLVTMYENMRPKDAAKIFNRLEMPVLIAVVAQINPRRMSEIMAQMQPEVAERLTVELAAKATGITPAAPATELPKIEGRPK